MDHTADEPPSTGSTILENIGSRQNSSVADRKLAAVNMAAQSSIRSRLKPRVRAVSASVMGIPDQERPR